MVAQSHNIPILSCNIRIILFVGRAKSQHICLGSRKVASYLFWFVQSRANFSVAQSHNIPILSRLGRNIPFLVRAKSHRICFGSRKVAQNFGRAKSQHTHSESQWPQHTFFGSRKVASYLFWVAQSGAKFRSRKVATLYFESQCSHYNFVGSCEGASYLFWVAQNASYLFWVAQSRAMFSVAQSRNLPIMSRNGRNMRFLGRAKSQ